MDDIHQTMAAGEAGVDRRKLKGPCSLLGRGRHGCGIAIKAYSLNARSSRQTERSRKH